MMERGYHSAISHLVLLKGLGLTLEAFEFNLVSFEKIAGEISVISSQDS